jgi:DNA-binding NtrC family response regulator
MNGDSQTYADEIFALEALLVEDDDLDAEILTTMADMNGACAIHFTRARTIIEAAHIMARSKFDIYFVDFCLGESSSLKLLASLEHSGARPVVVSNITRRDVERYRLNHGGVRFLAKGDCSPTRISDLVREALDARQITEAA